jgi:uncharacterized protein YjbJ (UPF0337 family)
VLYPLSYGGDGGSIPAVATGMRKGFSQRPPGNPRAMSNADKARIKVDKLTGQAKEKLGKATGNRRLQNEGKADQANAKVRSFGEKVKDAFRR